MGNKIAFKKDVISEIIRFISIYYSAE